MEKLALDTTKEELLHTLQRKGIHDTRVLAAIEKIAREKFVPHPFVRKAYNDVALPIGLNQTISQPYTVAYMTQELDVNPGLKVLEIGTGSGYQSAVLATMGAIVFSIERHQGLHDKAMTTLRSLGLHVHCVLGDGSVGYEQEAPYDRIIVTAGAPSVPDQLARQLNVGGRMIVPVGDSTKQQMTIVERVSTREFKTRILTQNFSFVPLLGEEGWDTSSIRSSS